MHQYVGHPKFCGFFVGIKFKLIGLYDIRGFNMVLQLSNFVVLF